MNAFKVTFLLPIKATEKRTPRHLQLHFHLPISPRHPAEKQIVGTDRIGLLNDFRPDVLHALTPSISTSETYFFHHALRIPLQPVFFTIIEKKVKKHQQSPRLSCKVHKGFYEKIGNFEMERRI